MINYLVNYLAKLIKLNNEFIDEINLLVMGGNLENYNTENTWNLRTTWYIGTCYQMDASIDCIDGIHFALHFVSVDKSCSCLPSKLIVRVKIFGCALYQF